MNNELASTFEAEKEAMDEELVKGDTNRSPGSTPSPLRKVVEHLVFSCVVFLYIFSFFF